MKTIKIVIIPIVALLFIALSSCDLTCEPYDAKTAESMSTSYTDLQILTNGTYASLVSNYYTRGQHIITEYQGDNVCVSGITSDTFLQTYRFTHQKRQSNSYEFWRGAYRMINAANTVIEAIPDDSDPNFLQLKAENLYLRAQAHFDIVRIWGRPYQQSPQTNLGVPYMQSTEFSLPARNTVKEVYDYVVADLLKAIPMFNQSKNSCYASKEVCYALLSRVYLFMDDYAKSIEYANLVINSRRYSLVPTESVPGYYRMVPENNPETIFANRYTMSEYLDRGAIGSMYYSDFSPATGWAEVYASQDYYDLVRKHPEDIRNSFIVESLDAEGNQRYRNDCPRYYILKYSFQDGVVNLSSPVYLRLAEMYMNRAEANIKLGNNESALEDINLIRARAGFSGSGLYSLTDLKGHASLLDVLLEERRLEFAFEHQRIFDLWRNNRPLVRAYIGYHSDDRFNQTILPTDLRLVHYIPEQERDVNPNLIDNP